MWMTKISETNWRKTRRPLSGVCSRHFRYTYVHSHKNCIVCPKFYRAAVHYKVPYSPYFTSVRVIRTSIPLPGTVLYTWHIRTTYQVPGKIYVHGTWYFTGIYLPNISRLCFLGYVQNHTRGIYPGYYPTKNFCMSARDFCKFCTNIHTCTRNFCKLGTPMPQIPGVWVQHFYTCPKLVWVLYARATIPGTSVSSVTRPYPYPGLL